MSEPDLSGIDPTRRAEMLRRKRLVVDYLAGPRTAVRRAAAAAELGVTPGQFLRLARAWRETKSLAGMHGTGASRGPRRPTRSLAAAAEAAITAALEGRGPNARFSDVFADVVRRCGTEGIKPPAGSTVYDRLNRHRRSTTPAVDPTRSVTIAGCTLRFPIAVGGEIRRPTALLAVLMPEGLVAAAEIGVADVRNPDLPRLLHRLRRLSTQGATPRPVLASSTLTGGAGETIVAGVALTRSDDTTSIISKVFGQRLGDLRITTSARSDRAFRERASGRLNSPPSRAEATSLLLRAIEAHNAARAKGEHPTFSLSPPGDAASVGEQA